MLDSPGHFVDGLAHRSGQQHDGSTLQGRIANLHDLFGRQVGDEADVDGVPHVDVVGETAGKIKAPNFRRRGAVQAQDDILAGVVGRLGLRQRTDIGPRDRHPPVRREEELALAAVQHPELVHPARAPQLGQQVDESRPTDSLDLRVAYRAVLHRAVGEGQRLDGSIVARHSVRYLSAFERGARGTRGCHQPVAVAHDDLGVGAHVDEHEDFLGLVGADGQQARCDVRADMTADERRGVDVGLGEHPQTQVLGADVEGGCRARARLHLQLDDRLVRLLADRLNVEAEEDVPHGGVADDDDLVDIPAMKAQRPRQLADLEVDGREHHLPELPAEGTAIV